jgi:integrative and conjugative element protein (TIGR02256 family)
MCDMDKSSPNLVVFKTDGAPAVSVSLTALNRIRDLVTGSTSKETGGILVGRNIGKNIEITDASDPGPNAQQTETHFLRDTAYCRDFLARCYSENGADYVGEWHSHVIGLRTLSAGDINTLVGILIDPDYDFVSFAVLLVIMRKNKLELRVYTAERGGYEPRAYIKIIEIYRGKFPDSQNPSEVLPE